MNNILDIFYNQVIKEAATGRVDCYFMYNVLFNCNIPSIGVETLSSYDNSSLLIPTLVIGEKDKFDKLLVQYVEKAKEFYSDFTLNILSDDLKVKAILTLLWSNAALEDFNNPVEFLNKRIAFLEDDKFKDNSEFSFWSDILNSEVVVNVDKSVVESETPYHLSIKLRDGEEEFYLPKVYFGVYKDKVYIYALQRDRNCVNEGKYAKKMNRFLYKVNDGLDVLNDTFDNYGVGNLKDVSSSFVLASNIALGLFREMGIREVIIPSILVTRWNAKKISNDIKRSMGRDDLILSDEEHDKLQANLTDRFIRTFRRLDYHHSGINIISYPFDTDSNMYMRLDENSFCNNKILEDTYFGISRENSLKK